MEKMINVQERTIPWEKSEEKKCFVPVSQRIEKEKKYNIGLNGSTTSNTNTTSSSTADVGERATTATATAGPITSSSRIINTTWRRMGELQIHSSLSPRHRISTTAKRRRGNCGISSSSTSSLFKGVKSLATTAPILIPFLIIFIVTVPAQANPNETVSEYPPSSITSTHVISPLSSTSTDKSVPSSSPRGSDEVVQSFLQKPPGNHHHHPASPSTTSSQERPSADDPSSSSSSNSGQRMTRGYHSCYVCLPPDKSSREAEEILSIFPEETKQHIPDCASFGLQTKNQFEFKCPPEYVGCLLRIHGKNESRSCGKLPLNDCKTANSVELCYCTGALCNGHRPDILFEETESDERQRSILEDEKDERETRKIWRKDETDDEDLLGPHHMDIDGMQDDTGDYGSGSEPPGVIAPYTSTPKPTLIPNLRPDTRTTTPKSVSGAPGTLSENAFMYIMLASLVPLLGSVILQLEFWDLYRQAFKL